jgi:hypothetical protein
MLKNLFIRFGFVCYPVQMSFCTDCGKFCYGNDNYCTQCGSPIEKISGSLDFTEKQVEAFNDPCIREELCNMEAGRWMLKEAAKEGLIRDPKVTKSLLEL